MQYSIFEKKDKEETVYDVIKLSNKIVMDIKKINYNTILKIINLIYNKEHKNLCSIKFIKQDKVNKFDKNLLLEYTDLFMKCKIKDTDNIFTIIKKLLKYIDYKLKKYSYNNEIYYNIIMS